MYCRKQSLLFMFAILSFLVLPMKSGAIDEKSSLKNTYFGNFDKCKVVKKEGKITLKRWEPYMQHVRTLPGPYVEPEGIDKITVDYDEIWIKYNDDDFPPQMRKRLRGKSDISKLYWKKNKVQASSLEKYFVGNPATGASFNTPSHKVVIIYGREQILNRIK